MRGILSFIVVLGALFDIGHCQTDCRNGYYDINTGTCWKLTGRTNWYDNRAKCQEAGGNIASVVSDLELEIVKGVISEKVSLKEGVFLGGNDDEQEGTWLWTDKSPVSSSYGWYTGFPKNRDTYNCIVIYGSWKWRWFDSPCQSNRYAVCKIPGKSLLDELKNFKKLSELSIGMTLEEYEAKETQCSAKGDFYDIKTGYCYKYKVLKDTRRKWNEARTQCKREDGDLAAIKSRQEWEVVKGLLKVGGTGHVWLGGTDEGVEGTWMWIDGSPVTFSYWYPGNPSGGSGYNCMGAFWHLSWRWFDAPCSANWWAVCKIPVEE